MLNNTVALLESGAAAAVGDYESIATVTVGAGGAANIEFSSIVGTYKHLQIRGIAFPSTGAQDLLIRFNSDTGANYSYHGIYGNGGTATAYSGTSTTFMQSVVGAGNATKTSCFAVAVVDILDYANTNKYKTIRILHGLDTNNTGAVDVNQGVVGMDSGSWRNTAAVSTIRLYPYAGNFAQYSSFALYGVK